jgi:hypothetical protein
MSALLPVCPAMIGSRSARSIFGAMTADGTPPGRNGNVNDTTETRRLVLRASVFRGFRYRRRALAACLASAPACARRLAGGGGAFQQRHPRSASACVSKPNTAEYRRPRPARSGTRCWPAPRARLRQAHRGRVVSFHHHRGDGDGARPAASAAADARRPVTAPAPPPPGSCPGMRYPMATCRSTPAAARGSSTAPGRPADCPGPGAREDLTMGGPWLLLHKRCYGASRAPVADEPNYLTAAFRSQYNLIGLGTAIGFAVPPARPCPAPGRGCGADGAAPGGRQRPLPPHPRPRLPDKVEEQQEKVQIAPRRCAPDHERGRYRQLQAWLQEIRHNYNALDSSSQMLLGPLGQAHLPALLLFPRMRSSPLRPLLRHQRGADPGAAGHVEHELATAPPRVQQVKARTKSVLESGCSASPGAENKTLIDAQTEDGAGGAAAPARPELLHARPAHHHRAARRPRLLGGGDRARRARHGGPAGGPDALLGTRSTTSRSSWSAGARCCPPPPAAPCAPPPPGGAGGAGVRSASSAAGQVGHALKRR